MDLDLEDYGTHQVSLPGQLTPWEVEDIVREASQGMGVGRAATGEKGSGEKAK